MRDRAEAAGEALTVRGKAKRAAAVHRHHLVHPIAEQEGAIQGRDARLASGRYSPFR